MRIHIENLTDTIVSRCLLGVVRKFCRSPTLSMLSISRTCLHKLLLRTKINKLTATFGI